MTWNMRTFLKRRRPADSSDSTSEGEATKKPSRAKQIALSVLILSILTVSILSSLPGSTIKNIAAPVLTPIARASGLDQSWSMFAPNPPKYNSAIEVHVIMADGTDKVWHPYEDDGMRKMQWRKLKEDILLKKEYRSGLALYAIRKVTEAGERPVRVVIIGELESIPLPNRGHPKTTRKVLLDKRVPATIAAAVSRQEATR